MQLIVMGMHRSGTSVLARLLNLMGAYFAPEGMGTGANEENPKGFWERRDVRALNDFVLHGTGCDWNRVSRFDVSAIPAPLLAEFDKRAAQIVLSMDANRPWFMKEPRLCLLLPLWRRVLEAPVCIHILRHPVEVASSLRTRNKIPIEAGLALWEAYSRSAAAGMEGLPRVLIRHRSLIQEPMATVTALHAQLEALDIRRLMLPAASEVASFVSAGLYREREGQQGLDAYTEVPQVKLFERWSTSKTLPKGDRDMAAKERRVLAAYEASLPVLEVPNPATSKKPIETELRERIVTGEREAQSLKERVRHLQALLGQREQQAAFVEAEFTALREASAARESVAMDVVAGLKGFAEAERVRLMEEVSRLAGKLEEATAAAAASEDRMVEDLQRAIASRQELSAEVELLRVELDSSRDAAEAMRKSAGDRERSLESRMEAMASTAAATQAARDALQVQVSRQEQELVQLTKLYLDARNAQARIAAIRAEADASHREKAMLIQRHAGEGKVLSDRLSETESRLDARRSEVTLLRDVNALYVSELACLDQRLAEIHAGAGTALVARVRRLRARFGGRRKSTLPDIGSNIDLLRRSRWFDGAWYTSQYPDVATSGLAPEVHYLTRGAVEARNPSPGFDTRHYLASNQDVASSGQNPLLHFIRHGEAEGRSPTPEQDA